MSSSISGFVYEKASDLRASTYDIICIGSGWAGRVLAAKLAEHGLNVLIIESDLIGGECPFYACVPSKALLRPSEALDAANLVDGAKQQVTSSKVDVFAVLQRRDILISNRDDTQVLVPMVLKAGVNVLRGTAKLNGVKKVVVTSSDSSIASLEANIAVAICTGSSPRVPNIPGLMESNPWMPKDATGAKRVPESLLILGTGAVGCEMATAYANFGTRVSLLGHSTTLLSKVESQAGTIVRKQLESLQVEVLLETSVAKVEQATPDEKIVQLSTGRVLKVTQILIATGRSANVKNIGLDSIGLRSNLDFIDVDESLLVKGVTGNWLYALGDVNGRAPLTHMCKYHGRIAASVILHNIGRQAPLADRTVIADHIAVPSVIFTNPQVATVGLTRAEAKSKGIEVEFIESSLFSIGSLIHGVPPEEGWACWVVDAKSQRLLGMTLVGRDIAEIIHAATMAIIGGLTLQQLAHAVPSFPTLSEVFLNLLESAGF